MWEIRWSMDRGYSIYDENGKLICRLGEARMDSPECLDLILTAPEMLRVLKEVHEGYGLAYSKRVDREKVGRIIAKAEGRDYEPEKSPCSS